MNAHQKAVAQGCMEAAETGAMTFPQIVGMLIAEGFESYTIDFRRRTATYYLPDGDSVELKAHGIDTPVAADFDVSHMKAAIHEAQTLAPGYTYKGFCEKAKAAGCAGYMVSFLGKRAVYFGRGAETHVEYFPGTNGGR